MTNLIMTGATGFLGSHILLEWLSRFHDAQALCLVRAENDTGGRQRIEAALSSAISDTGTFQSLNLLMSRITVVATAIDRADVFEKPACQAWLAAKNDVEFIHCAANLSFSPGDAGQVWSANVTTTEHLLDAVENTPCIRCFNHVSTAYVAGDAQGIIKENFLPRPATFNNAYEESKWTAECLLQKRFCGSTMRIRIFRPSIIIANSRTFKISSVSGFYKVIARLRELHLAQPDINTTVPLRISALANLNLIPVDIVVTEMLAIMQQAYKTENRIFHLTNERPMSIADLFLGISPLTGIDLKCDDGSDHQTSRRSRSSHQLLIERGLRHYLPYLSYNKIFDRSNIYFCGADQRQAEYWLDITQLRRYVKAFFNLHTIAVDKPDTHSDRQHESLEEVRPA